jgi:tetratricopeptide (TPR) repeat protein
LGFLLEAFIGAWRLIVIYLVSGMFGNLMSMIFSPYFSTGASSAWMGMLGALILYVFVYGKEMPRNFNNMLKFFILITFAVLLAISMQFPNTDNFAHAGGFIGGMLAFSLMGTRYPRNLHKIINWKIVAVSSVCFLIISYSAMQPYNNAYSFYYAAIGEEDASKGNYCRAIAYIERSMELGSNFDAPVETLGKVYSKLGLERLKNNNIDGSLYYFIKAVSVLPLEEANYQLISQLYEQIGLCYEDKKDIKSSLKYFLYAFTFRPNSITLKNHITSLLLLSARSDFSDGDYEQAEEKAKESIKFGGDDSFKSRILLGLINYIRGNFWNAASIWTEVAKIDKPDNNAEDVLEKYIFKSLWYHVNIPVGKKIKSAKAVKLNKDGEILILKSGKYKQARELFNESLQLEPDNISALYNLGKLEAYLGNEEKVNEIIEKILKIDPDNRQAYTLKGIVLSGKENIQGAIESFQKSINPGEKYSEPPGFMGKEFRIKNDYADAEFYLKKAIEYEPNNGLWHIELARVYKDTKRTGEYLKEINTALALARAQERPGLEVYAGLLLKNKVAPRM